MTLNILKIGFAINLFTAGFFGLLINFFEKYLPSSLSKVYRHGKFAVKEKNLYLKKYEVPKRWFRHFYAFAGPFCTAALILLYYRYYLNGKLPDIVVSQLRFYLGSQLQSLIPPENVLLAMILFVIHVWKRFYESHFVSVYSDTSMNCSIYFLGFFHYFGSALCIIGETSGLIEDSKIVLNWTRLTWLDYISAIIFLISTYLQYRTNIILSNLRCDKRGNVVTKKHKVPYGELYNYVSAPLQLTEIILYLCLNAILRTGSSFYFVSAWVVVNQMECAYLSHEWYLNTFESYPKSRKIIIPYIF